MMRLIELPFDSPTPPFSGGLRSLGLEIGWVLCWLIEAFWPCVALWSASLLSFEFVAKSPKTWTLAGRAGIISCPAIGVASLVGLTWTALIRFLPGPRRSQDQISVLIPLTAGAAVLGTWWLLFLVRGWRFDTFDWVDTSGIFLGLYWIFLLPFDVAVFFFIR